MLGEFIVDRTFIQVARSRGREDVSEIDVRDGDETIRGTALFGRSWSFVSRNPGSLVALGTVPLLIAAIFAALGQVLLDVAPTPAVVGIRSIGFAVAWTMFGVAWHRLILLDERTPPDDIWSATHTRFALYLLVWQVPSWLLSFYEPTMESAGGLALLACTILVVIMGIQARLGIWLPALAIGRPLPFERAWRASRGYGLPILCAGILCALVVGLFTVPLLVAMFWMGVQQVSADVLRWFELAYVPFQLIFEALAVGTLSYAYGEIRAHGRV